VRLLSRTDSVYLWTCDVMVFPQSDLDQIAKKAIEMFGGREKFFAAADQEQSEINARWSQNVDVIGRILRAHLFVEHFLSLYLAKANPRLGSMTDARLSFAQKVALLDVSNPDVAHILPGIKRLNAIRNRLAHNLNAHVTEEDAQVFLRCERFAALRSAKAKSESVGNSSLEILEDFARHTSIAFTYEFSPIGQVMAKAIEEFHRGRLPK